MSGQGSLPAIRKTVILNAPIEKVWKAIATSEGIASWWMPNTFEPVVGQAFILHAGQFGDSPCKVTDIEPKKLVGFDWGKDWHLELRLQELPDGKTEITLVHSGWNENQSTEFGQPHSIIRGIMDAGWDKIVHDSLVRALGA